MKKRASIILTLSCLLATSAAAADLKHGHEKYDKKHEKQNSKQIQTPVVYSTLTFKSDKGDVILKTENNFQTAELTGPGGFSQIVSEPVPGDGRPIPASGMLLSNYNGYFIQVGNDNSGLLTIPNETLKLSDGSLVKEIYFKDKRGKIITLISHGNSFEDGVLKLEDGESIILKAAPTRMAGVTLENTHNHIKLHFILESNYATVTEKDKTMDLKFTTK